MPVSHGQALGHCHECPCSPFPSSLLVLTLTISSVILLIPFPGVNPTGVWAYFSCWHLHFLLNVRPQGPSHALLSVHACWSSKDFDV